MRGRLIALTVPYLLGTASYLLGEGAYAQEVPVPQSASTQVQEVIVTAGKTGASSLEKTPIAISAFSSAELDSAGLTSVQDLQGFVPSLSIAQSNGYAEIFIRGIGSTNVSGGSEPDAAVEVDGVYLARPYSQFSDFLDVDRVEVLRGPQGTLYGRNAVAGVINVDSKLPTDEYHGEERLTVGDYSLVQNQAYLSGPLVRNVLQGSVAVSYISHSPYLENIVPSGKGVFDADQGGIRTQLRFEPTGRIEATTRLDYSKSKDAPESFPKLLAPFDLATNSILGSYSKVALNTPVSETIVNDGIAEDVKVHLATHLELRSITAYRQASLLSTIDADESDLNIEALHTQERQRQFSQEVNFIGNYKYVSFVAGAYYFSENILTRNSLTIVPSHLAALFTPNIPTDSEAGFVNGTFHLPENVDITLGGRYTAESKTLNQDAAYYLDPTGAFPILTKPPGAITAVGPVLYKKSIDDSAFTPKVGIQWYPNRDLMLYASATRGFKSGGVDYTALNSTTATFEPEKVWSYEVGAKSYFFDRRLRANLTGFYYDYDNLQVEVITSPTTHIIGNAASAVSEGVELELAATPIHNLNVGVNLSGLNAFYVSYPNAPNPATFGGGLVNASGKELDQAPHFSGNLYAEYDHELSFGGNVVGRVDYSFQSRQFFEPSNARVLSQGTYGILNLKVGYELPLKNQNIEVDAWVRNATDTGYITEGFDAAVTFAGGPGAPRTFGATVTAKF